MKKGFRYLKSILVTILAASLLLSGCGKGGEEKASSEGEVLNVAYFPTSFKSSLSTIAYVKGFFEEEGVNVNLVNLQSSADSLVALQEGKIDVNPLGITNTIQAIEDGEGGVVIIGGSAQAGGIIITTPENADKFKDLNNWKGATWATGRSYTGDFVVRHYLSEIGIDSNVDVSSVDLGDNLSIIQSVSKGEADVGYITADGARTALDYGLELITDVDDIEHAYPCCRISSTQNAVDTKGDQLVAYLRAVIRAYDFILTNPDETIKIFTDLTSQDEDYVRDVLYGDFASAYVPDPARQKVLNFSQYLLEAQALSSTDGIKEAINVDLYKKALDQILTKYPDNENYKTLLEIYNEFDS